MLPICVLNFMLVWFQGMMAWVLVASGLCKEINGWLGTAEVYGFVFMKSTIHLQCDLPLLEDADISLDEFPGIRCLNFSMRLLLAKFLVVELVWVVGDYLLKVRKLVGLRQYPGVFVSGLLYIFGRCFWKSLKAAHFSGMLYYSTCL